MTESKKQPKVIDCQASDNEYLHRDFHGAMCYSIAYLDDNFGPEATEEYLQQVARTYYAPLAEQVKQRGLVALEEHWREVFTREQGDFDLRYEDGVLVLTVKRCPAVAHMKEQGCMFTNRYCETTVVVNRTICCDAGFACSCDYEPGEGRCVQRFWKP